jgi:hypothetical protein
MNKLKKLGFKKVPGTSPGFHMYELTPARWIQAALSHKLQAASHKRQAASNKHLTKLNRYRIIEDINKRRNMESTIKLIQQMNKTLVEVIQFLDSNGHSDTDVRKKVDTILNFTNDLKEESEMELTKLTLVE